MGQFDTRDLQLFVVLAECLNFRQAALRCHIDQGALSRRIQRLEATAAAQLFQRDRRSVSLTAAGRAFLVDAQQILNSLNQAKQRLADTAPATARRKDPRPSGDGTNPPSRLRLHGLSPEQLFGRDAELQRLRHWLLGPGDAVLTLVGPGGVGKTALALAALAQVAEHFSDGADAVDLATAHDAPALHLGVAACLGLPQVPGAAVLERLESALHGQQRLLLLDNLEQVAGAAAAVAALAQHLPGMRLLCTSRMPLGLDGEHVLEVLPLEVPAAAEALDVGTQTDARDLPVVRLFEARAGRVVPGFQLSSQDLAAALDLLRLLDGLPLAIEVTASRADLFSVTTLRAQLLAGQAPPLTPARESLGRHASMTAALQGSVDALPVDVQTAYAALSVYAGWWQLGDAQALLDTDALAAVVRLVDRRLLSSHREGDDTRFRMLEVVRRHAHERLVGAGRGQAVNERFARHVLQRLRDVPEDRYLVALGLNPANVDAAIAWALQQPQPAGWALPLAARAWKLWLRTGALVSGLRCLEQVLAACTEPSSERTACLVGAGTLCYTMSDFESGRRHAQAAVQAAQAAGDDLALAAAGNVLGVIGSRSMDWPGARAGFGLALQAARRLQVGPTLVQVLCNHGTVLWLSGEPRLGQQHLTEALQLLDDSGEKKGRSIILHGLAACALQLEQPERALELVKQALRTELELRNVLAQVSYLLTLVDALAQLGRLARAATWLGLYDRMLVEARVPMGPLDKARLARVEALVTQNLPSADLDRHRHAGRRLRLQDLLDVDAQGV